MFLLIKKLVKEYIKIYIYVYCMGLIMRMIVILNNVEVIRAINGVWTMVSATLLVVLSTYYIYEFLYTRQKYFYYTIKYSRLKILFMMAIILTFLNFVYYLLYSNLNIWNGFQKFISLLVYFISVGVILYSYRSLTSKKTGFNLFLLTLVSFLMSYALIFYRLFSEQLQNKVMIGVSSVAGAENIYIGIVPVTVLVDNSTYLELSRYSLGINVLLLVIFSMSLLNIRKLKINW